MSSSSAASSTRPSRSSTSAWRPRNVSSFRVARACSALTRAARSWSSQKPASPISPSSASMRRASASGSKVVREQLELVADRREALGGDVGRGGGRHASDVTRSRGPGGRAAPSGAVALLELLARAAGARIVAPDLVVLAGDPLLNDGRERELLLVHLAVGVGLGALVGAGHRHGDRLGAAHRPAARVGGATSPRGRAGGGTRRRHGALAVAALDLHLDVVDHPREVGPDRV